MGTINRLKKYNIIDCVMLSYHNEKKSSARFYFAQHFCFYLAVFGNTSVILCLHISSRYILLARFCFAQHFLFFLAKNEFSL